MNPGGHARASRAMAGEDKASELSVDDMFLNLEEFLERHGHTRAEASDIAAVMQVIMLSPRPLPAVIVPANLPREGKPK